MSGLPSLPLTSVVGPVVGPSKSPVAEPRIVTVGTCSGVLVRTSVGWTGVGEDGGHHKGNPRLGWGSEVVPLWGFLEAVESGASVD